MGETRFVWTPEAEETARRLRGQGASWGDIGRALGCYPENARLRIKKITSRAKKPEAKSAPDTTWTPERVAELTRLWNEGNSARQIAVIMGLPSRNAAIGKVHRLKLPPRARRAPASAKPRRPVPAKPVSLPPACPSPAVESREAAPEVPVSGPAAEATAIEHVVETAACLPETAFSGPTGVVDAILALKHRDCKWPIGSPADATFRFCGEPRATSEPYCEHHCRVAYPPRARKQDPETVAKRARAVMRAKARNRRLEVVG